MNLILVTFFAACFMFAFELFQPRRRWPAVSGWWGRALLLNAFQVLAVLLAGVAWDQWMQGYSFWHLDEHMGPNFSALVGYLVITFVYYWWHRARHQNQFLWNWLHQIHHSAQRLEIITSFYKHPFEILINSILTSAVLYILLGLSLEAAAGATLLTGLAELFYHWNVKTPYWLGFIFQRPESHCVHHKRGWHTQNFSDLPLWDIMFGTFHNPRNCESACGFKENRETQLMKMLIGRNVNAPRKNQ